MTLGMNFKDYLNQMPEQGDTGLNSFLHYVKTDRDFPVSSDPVVLGKYLYLKLNEEQTTGFQKLYIFYANFEQNNDVPTKYKNNQEELLNGVNTIVFMQNEDPEYKG